MKKLIKIYDRICFEMKLMYYKKVIGRMSNNILAFPLLIALSLQKEHFYERYLNTNKNLHSVITNHVTSTSEALTKNLERSEKKERRRSSMPVAELEKLYDRYESFCEFLEDSAQIREMLKQPVITA